VVAIDGPTTRQGTISPATSQRSIKQAARTKYTPHSTSIRGQERLARGAILICRLKLPIWQQFSRMARTAEFRRSERSEESGVRPGSGKILRYAQNDQVRAILAI
jgi:hypothetical protein